MRRVEEESPPTLASGGEGLSSLSYYSAVVLGRVLFLLLREEDAGPPCPSMVPSSAIEDEDCPQSKDESPSPLCSS